LLWSTVGGLGSITGGTLGAVFLTTFPELISNFEDYEMVIYGFLLAVTIMFSRVDWQEFSKNYWADMLQISDISISFGGIKALHNVSFQLNNGINALIGPNGAGKQLFSMLSLVFKT